MRRTRSGGIAAAPIPATRSREKSVRLDVGMLEDELPLGGHARRHRDALVADEAQRLGGGPRLAREHDRRARWRARPTSASCSRRAGTAARRAAGRRAACSSPMLREIAAWRSWSYTAPFGAPGRPARPHDAGRVGRVEPRAGARVRRRAKASLSAVDGDHVAGVRRRRGRDARRPRTVTTGSLRATMLACSLDAEPQVDRGGDRADPERAEVAGGELRRRREHQARRRRRARRPWSSERGGEAVGGAVEPSVRRRACRRARRPRARGGRPPRRAGGRRRARSRPRRPTLVPVVGNLTGR